MMWSRILVLTLLSNAVLGAARARLPLKKRATSGASVKIVSNLASDQDGDDNVGNAMDIRYTTNITLNNKEILVVLDTGSSDLWVMPPDGMGTLEDTGIQVDLEYGTDGEGVVEGTVAISSFEFGPYKVDRQAFLNADSSNLAGVTEFGIYGVLGLGFNGPNVSPINEMVLQTGGDNTTWGASALHNIFAQNPAAPNFIGLALDRTNDLEDTTGGSFTIGEYDPDYLAVKNSPKLYQYPSDSGRWTILLDGVIINGESVPLQSSVDGTPDGKAVALLDSGTPTALLPTSVIDSIYSRISGSVKYDAAGTWLVPCEASFDVDFVFGDIAYPVHPLDLTTINSPVDVDGQNYTVCIGTLVGFDGADEKFDALLGDTFLRNVYTIFDFGDDTGDNTAPFIQLLSTTDPVDAALDVTTIRNATLASLPPELSPSEVVDGVSSTDSTDAYETPDEDGTELEIEEEGDGNDDADSSFNANLADNNDSETTSAGSSFLDRHGPAIIGLLAANLFIGLVLVTFAVASWIRRGGRDQKKKGTYSAVELKDDSTPGYGPYQVPYGQ
ncbi:acid protease [Pluteus cervinus]|uniref:Acid protease n=1 Tax=Pluteus cervinus TaxID=181527 RepID=A0ACD3B7M2_9AGAR|nr:acid protease [Pluteus cervinus]